VVSLNPAAGAELIGHAVVIASLLGAVYGSDGVVVPALGTLVPAAPAVLGTSDTVAQITAKLTSSALRFLKLVSILPPYCLQIRGFSLRNI
jgi:microcystin-dependent protein